MQIIKLRNKISPKTLIIGNGDITSLKEIEIKYKQYGCEGFMVGRGVLANPWMFSKTIKEIGVEDRIKTFLDHIEIFDKTWGKDKNAENLKKFCKAYVNNFKGAVVLRNKIMSVKTTDEFKEIISSYLKIF